VERWQALLAGGMTAEAFVAALSQSPRFRHNRNGVPTCHPPGHYYSPVVDPSTVHDYVAAFAQARPEEIAGIRLSIDDMAAFWTRHQALIAATPFPMERDPRYRYCGSVGYPLGDATILRTMIHAHRPRRIVEIGSGNSTACMLDTADEAGLDGLAITCVEPDATRLRSIMRPGDERRVTIFERGVQMMDLAPFRALEANDILFIDSTHVLKTGSDVHYELFHIMPVLRPGVIVHVHDCRYPFEYPKAFIFEYNRSWNEAYALRAFLMWNSRFEVIFWNSMFGQFRPSMVRETFPEMARNPGGAIWLAVREG
jgi:predicted O-methyltransferase YrrM